MRQYDKTQPLVFIHIPKAAGTSTRQIFDNWFGSGLLPHYYHEAQGSMPVRHKVFELQQKQAVVVYGHFNRRRHFGVGDYYPELSQFITILRDPFEQVISSYFYMREHAGNWLDKDRRPEMSVENYILQSKFSVSDFFPRQLTLENYKEVIETDFIEIGLVECLELSMQRIASKLGLPYVPESLEKLNVTERDSEILPEWRALFMESKPLEYEVYNYVKEKF